MADFWWDVNRYINKKDWFDLCVFLKIPSDSNFKDVMKRLEELNKERQLLVNSLKLCMTGDPEYIDKEVWNLPDWKQYDDTNYL